jgi:hypothetical protein
MPFDHSKKNTFGNGPIILGGPFNSADGINPLFSMLGNILNNNQSLYSDDEESDEDRDDDEEND